MVTPNSDWEKALDVCCVLETGSHIAQAVLVLAMQSESSEPSAPTSKVLGL